MSRLKIDLHEVYNNSSLIDAVLNEAVKDAIDKRIKVLEIIHGKGSGQLKKRVLKFLETPEIKKLYHRIDKDRKNFGRLFVYFRY